MDLESFLGSDGTPIIVIDSVLHANDCSYLRLWQAPTVPRTPTVSRMKRLLNTWLTALSPWVRCFFTPLRQLNASGHHRIEGPRLSLHQHGCELGLA
jgi:hypothetical protein